MNIKKFVLLLALPALLLSSLLIAKPASADSPSGSLACTISDGKVWNVTGNYSDVAPQTYLYMYRGTTYVARTLTGDGSNVPVDLQFAGQSTAQTYYLYDGTSSSDPLIGQATCAAIAAPASTPAATTTTPTSTTSSGGTTATPAATTPAATTTPTTVSGSGSTSGSSYSYGTLGTNTNTVNFGVLMAILAVVIAIAVFYIVCVWKVFKKAGKPGWAAIIPLYNGWVVLEIGGKPGWWILVSLIPFVGLITLVISGLASIEMGRRFGKGGIFGFFLLFLLAPIGWPILALGKAQYTLPPAPVQVQ